MSSFVSAMKSMFGGSGSAHDGDGPLKLGWETYLHEPEEGEAFEAYLLVVSGTVRVPMASCPVRLTVTFEDTTVEGQDPAPVSCTVPSLANARGDLHLERDLTLEGQPAVLKGYPLAILPHACLKLARRGEGRVTIRLNLRGTDYYSDTTYGAAELVVSVPEEGQGYVERAQGVMKGEASLASLAMAMCASDGHVDARETAVIQSFFRQHARSEHEPGVVSQRVTDAMEDALSNFYWQGGSQQENIERACADLRAMNVEGLIEIAYELCLDVAAADTEVTEEEQLALEQAGQALGLDGALRAHLERRNEEVQRVRREVEEQMRREGLL